MGLKVPLEAEDLDLGTALADDLADDVDGNAEAETDDEALDTDDDGLDAELGIDAEESEGKCRSSFEDTHVFIHSFARSPYAHRAAILASAER